MALKSVFLKLDKLKWRTTRAHKWAKEANARQFPNCHEDYFKAFLTSFPIIKKLSVKLAAELSDNYPNMTLYALLAASRQHDPAQRLRFAKRAFWNSSFDHFVQEQFRAACHNFVVGHDGASPARKLGFICSRPFEALDLGENGKVNACCSGWSPQIVGSLRGSDIQSIWNGEALQKIRSQFVADNYQSCSQMLCPQFQQAASPSPQVDVSGPFGAACAERQVEETYDHPLSLHLNYEASCNLACGSCRPGLFVANAKQLHHIDETYLPVIESALPKLKRLWITGSGDPFASRHFRKIMKLLKKPENRHIQIDLQTNGLLLDERTWRSFDFNGRVRNVIVSIDAGNAETYANVRNGGDFQCLLRNLEFLGKMRAEGQIEFLRLDSVIQACNFEEIPDIRMISSRYGFDSCFFSILTNWGHLAESEFSNAFVFSPDHPRHDNLFRIYQSLKHDRQINWGNLPAWFLPASERTGQMH